MAAGIVGRWSSNFGPVTLEHAAITGREPVVVRGFWQQDPGNADCPLQQPLPGCLGQLGPGTFDPVTRVLELAYYQDWNDTRGLARFPYRQMAPSSAAPGASRGRRATGPCGASARTSPLARPPLALQLIQDAPAVLSWGG